MLLRLTFAAAACCTLSSAVLADEFAFSDFAETVVIGSVSLDNARALPAQPVSTITAGKLTVTLEKTRLEDVQVAFGGTIQNDGEAGNGITWLCYAAADATLWFSAFTGDGTVSQVTSEADTTHAATSGCSQAPAALTVIDYGIPGLGAPLADFTAKFGKVEDDVGLYSYSSEVTAPESADFRIFQYVIVIAPAGTISGITVGQATSN
ncbi:MAG: hypothetical protein JWR51_4468 [Devosia sp.]|uniref:hypothetical protein n=1 Tax=Devosia sp. TaxID=1871048 RepID=UPI002630EF43|nr:hypothetical protein [Devosia sp.]MDB5531365.1 hypothetical protein [Devosia sp.]